MKMVAMETQHWWNVEKVFFFFMLSFIFFSVHPLFSLRNCLLGDSGDVSNKDVFAFLSTFFPFAEPSPHLDLT